MSRGHGQGDEIPVVNYSFTFDGERPNPDRFKHDYTDPRRPDPNAHAPNRPDPKTKASPQPIDPVVVGGLIAEGNRRYASFIRDCRAATSGGRCSIQNHDYRLFLNEGEVGADPNHQSPYGAILSCIDSRVPIEIVTGQAPNDVFSIRTAGNVLMPIEPGVAGGGAPAMHHGGEARASLEYILLKYAVGAPTGHKTLSAILVLGHTKCGAIEAAYDAIVGGTAAPTPSLVALVEATRPAVELVVRRYPNEAPDVQKDMIALVNSVYSRATVAALATSYGVANGLRVYYGTYHVSNFAIIGTDLPGYSRQRVPELFARMKGSKAEAEMNEALTWKAGKPRPDPSAIFDDDVRNAILEDALNFARARKD